MYNICSPTPGTSTIFMSSSCSLSLFSGESDLSRLSKAPTWHHTNETMILKQNWTTWSSKLGLWAHWTPFLNAKTYPSYWGQKPPYCRQNLESKKMAAELNQMNLGKENRIPLQGMVSCFPFYIIPRSISANGTAILCLWMNVDVVRKWSF